MDTVPLVSGLDGSQTVVNSAIFIRPFFQFMCICVNVKNISDQIVM